LNSITIRAPSTIANLGPGFDIFSLALEHPYVELRVQLNDTDAIKIDTDGCREDMPDDPQKNCAGLAIIDLLKKVNHSTGVLIEPKKTITIGAGLGSSGACASAAVYGVNKLLGLGLSTDKMIEIASQGEIASGSVAHADNVAGSMLGGFVIVKSYQPIEVIRVDVPEIPVVIGVMRKTQRTTRPLIPNSISLDVAKQQMALCARVVHSIITGDIKELGVVINQDYISEPVRSRAIPGYRTLKKRLLDGGAYGCNVSGGGLSVFAICDKQKTSDIAEIMKRSFAEQNIDIEMIITCASNQGIREISVE
jgi:homoserine kinase